MPQVPLEGQIPARVLLWSLLIRQLLRRSAFYAIEALSARRVAREVRGQHLERHLSTKPRIASTIHLTHATRAQRGDSFVGAEMRSVRQLISSLSARGASAPQTRPIRHRFGPAHCSFAYSALACFRMGMSGSASFHREMKSLYAARALAVSPDRA
jgi:hypothetical protein